MTTIHETPGNVGIMSTKTYLFVCGGCYTNQEIHARNLQAAKEEARKCGWKNGFATRLGAMSGSRATPSAWRCEECVALSRRLPLAYDPVRYEWRRT